MCVSCCSFFSPLSFSFTTSAIENAVWCVRVSSHSKLMSMLSLFVLIDYWPRACDVHFHRRRHRRRCSHFCCRRCQREPSTYYDCSYLFMASTIRISDWNRIARIKRDSLIFFLKYALSLYFCGHRVFCILLANKYTRIPSKNFIHHRLHDSLLSVLLNRFQNIRYNNKYFTLKFH